MQRRHASVRMGEAMTISLTPEVEKALEEEAQSLGVAPEELALEILEQGLARRETVCAEGPRNLADYLEEYIGAIDSSEYVPGGARMSEATGKKFAAGLLTKHRGRKQ